MKKSIVAITLLAICTFTLASFTTGNDPTDGTIKLTFVDHLKAGLIEQDVYVEKVPGSGKVYRVLPTERDKYLDAPIYKTKEPIHHDPFDQNLAGPYPKGESFGMTLGEWLKAAGTGTYRCEEGWGTFQAEFTHLMPNATYTIWHFFMAAPPTVPFNGTLDLPLGDRDGHQSVFSTDAQGNAVVNVKFERCLQLSDDQLMAGMAIALHSDGKTYGPVPGDFGSLTHVQLFAILPEAD